MHRHVVKSVWVINNTWCEHAYTIDLFLRAVRCDRWTMKCVRWNNIIICFIDRIIFIYFSTFEKWIRTTLHSISDQDYDDSGYRQSMLFEIWRNPVKAYRRRWAVVSFCEANRPFFGCIGCLTQKRKKSFILHTFSERDFFLVLKVLLNHKNISSYISSKIC